MEIRKKFDDLVVIMNDPFKAEKLISKKFKLDLYAKFNNKVTEIIIDEYEVKCSYNVDAFYKFNLKFKKTSDGYIDFSLSAPSLFYLIIIGGILGIRLIDNIGYIGIFIGVGVFALISYGYKSYLQQSIWNRINERWNQIEL